MHQGSEIYLHFFHMYLFIELINCHEYYSGGKILNQFILFITFGTNWSVIKAVIAAYSRSWFWSEMFNNHLGVKIKCPHAFGYVTHS